MDTNDNILGADAGLAGTGFVGGGEEELHNNLDVLNQQHQGEENLPISSSLGDLGPSDQQLALDDPTSQLALQSAAMLAVDPILAQQEVTVTDNDVLFGRGGHTNKHPGNLRYRDMINTYRPSYVSAQKIEKPNVARQVVKAMKEGDNPVRFLRKGEDNKWYEVSDKEAAWKSSQALREKSRWSSMKKEEEDVEAVDSTTKKSPIKRKKRKSSTTDQLDPKKRGKIAGGKMLPIPTQVSHIEVPAVESFTNLGHKEIETYLSLPTQNSSSTGEILPNDEDVLFGRGGRTNTHPGNQRLRDIVDTYRSTYSYAKKVEKPKISRLIVKALRCAQPPSRFLRMNDDTSRWEDVGDKRAAEKVSQTLREKDKEGATQEQVETMVKAAMQLQAIQLPTAFKEPSPIIEETPEADV